MAILTDKSSNSWVQRGGPVDGDFIDGDEMSAYLDQLGERTNYLYALGICPHSLSLNYPAGAFCQSGGSVYRALLANTSKPPASNAAIWEKCAISPSDAKETLDRWVKDIAWGTGNNAAPYQVQNATLTALTGMTTSADKLIYATGADTFALTPLTAFIRTLLDDADAVAARSTLGAAPLASPTLTGVPTAPTATSGTNNNQIATTAFVNAVIENYSPKIELTYGDGV